MTPCKSILLTVLGIAVSTFSQAQISVQRSGVRYSYRPNKTTPITNAVTGQRITVEEYEALLKPDPYAYHLVADYDEYGQPSAYTVRPTTPEEHETHRFRDRDPAKQPKVGQPIAPFVMTGTDGKMYRSADLLGKVVLLSFWVTLDKPIWREKDAEELTRILQPYASSPKLTVLGVLNSEPPTNPAGYPFAVIPNAYGFNNKYHITTLPTFIVIDKMGNVVVNLQGSAGYIYEKLRQVLATALQ